MPDLSTDTLAALLAGATPGEWEWVPHRLRGGSAGLIAGRNEVLWPATANDGDTGDAWFESTAEADQALISLAPALAREVLRLRALGGRDAE